MPRHRSFKSELSTDEPITFDLEGETFTCLPDAPAGVLLNALMAVGPDGTMRAAHAIRFLEGVLVEEDTVRFRILLSSKDKIVRIETLAELVEWLNTEYNARPTRPPSG